jgi:hypothetical protein
MAHINDTGEKLSGIVVKPKTAEEFGHVLQMSVFLKDEQRASSFIDLRQAQDGLSLRTFRRRHPAKESPQRDIVATVYGAFGSLPEQDD